MLSTLHSFTFAGSGKNSGSAPMTPQAQTAAEALMRQVFDSCLRALANLGILLEEVASATAPVTSKAALLLLQQQMGIQQLQGGQEPGGPAGGGMGQVRDRGRGKGGESHCLL